METAPLKSFATWARTALIREVTARIAVVLAPASLERVEQPKAVEALEKAVTVAGGGSKGKDAVADKVAYTWFNRIIALRFMDANGYTSAGVVSPQAGVPNGQPEILAEAKRGNIDTAVVGANTRDTVTGLLNGTRRSDDGQGEAYALLLADYCRYWNRAMPFMFEREGDFTELLIPANLLANDSVPSRAVNVLTAEVCRDVEVIGWLYQFYISERKDEVFAGFKKNKKAGADEIPAATQLFTPHWIVRYLVENSLGRLWMLNRPSSRLVDEMDYYLAPVDEEADFLKITKPQELKVIDPACGSGHMLTYAFDLLYAIYEEEGYAPSEIPGLILTKNLYGTEIDPRAGALAAFALTMKARAKQRTFFNTHVKPNVCVVEPISFSPDELGFLVTRGEDRHAEVAFWNQFAAADTFGSLIQPDSGLLSKAEECAAALDRDTLTGMALAERAQQVVEQSAYLTRKYSVVVTNPPYMGSRNMDADLARFVERDYPDGRRDLMTAFMLRCRLMTERHGLWAMINIPSWMFLSSSAALRHRLIAEDTVCSLVHLGRGVFGSDFGTVAFVMQRSPPTGKRATYRRLFDRHVEVRPPAQIEKLFLDRSYNTFDLDQAAFEAIPGEPIVYWLSDALRAAFATGKPLGELTEPRQGLATADNARFLRQWWEVGTARTAFGCADRAEAQQSHARWFPYNKGGEFRKWYGNQEHVVNWGDDGAAIRAFGTEDGARARSRAQNTEFYFRRSVSWSDVTSGAPAFRVFPPGFIHDVTGMSVFAADAAMAGLVSFLNSTVATALLAAVAPTIHVQIGDVAVLPVHSGTRETLGLGVDQLVSTAKQDWDSYETSWEFAGCPLIDGTPGRIQDRAIAYAEHWQELSEDQRELEEQNNVAVANLYEVSGEVETAVALDRVSLGRNASFTYGPGKSAAEYAELSGTDVVKELISYAVGCMFGRYSLDRPGLILGSAGDGIDEYLERVSHPSLMPDADNVIPVVDGDWFEDDIVARARQFVRAAFGEQHFEENLRFVTESLGVKDIRDYFVRSFYKDHVQRYKKRPIYWLFSSPKGSFNALIYMHRYTPSTASTVLNEYLREFQSKLSASLQQQERLVAGGDTPRQQAAAQKEADRLRKVLLELEEYEHDVLYPLASRQLAIDLDDGVKSNYPKFGAALKKIVGLEANDE
jgi:hypothetical protein